MTEDVAKHKQEPDTVLASMERKYSFHRDMAQKILRDIADYKRIRSEYPDASPSVAGVEAAQPQAPAPIAPAPPSPAPALMPWEVPSAAQAAIDSGLEAQPKSNGLPWRYEPFDGTFASLVRHYRVDSGSPYFRLHVKVRKNYDVTINKLMLELGHERIADISAAKIQNLYDGWKAGGKVATAHGNIGKVRLLASFGTTALNDDACAKLSIILSKMEFEIPQARTERLTADQATAIRAKAHEMGRPSIALAQALQYDLKLKQVEVVGEWLPISDSSTPESDITWNDEKWIRGLRWSEIDDRLVLRRPINWRHPDGEKFEADLRSLPMIKEEVDLINSGSRNGAVVICEWTGKPWKQTEFRRWWRKVADAASVPKEVKNMDNRADPVRTGRFADLMEVTDGEPSKPNIIN
jgi:hypothetical protein